MEAGERIEVLEKWKQVHVDRHIELEEKVERLLAELAEIRQTSGRIKEIIIKDPLFVPVTDQGKPIRDAPRLTREKAEKEGLMPKTRHVSISDSGKGKDK